jgi:hypothetical protein
VNEVVIPHLAGFDVFAESHNMKGKISIDRVGRKLNGLIHNYDFVTTLYDFYGFKGLSDNETKQSLEDKIKNKIKKAQRDKIIPYIQMYESNALLLKLTVLSFRLTTQQTLTPSFPHLISVQAMVRK